MMSNFKVEDNSYEKDFGSAQEVYENCMNVGIKSGVKLNSASVLANHNSTPQSSKLRTSLSASGNQKLSSSTPNLTEISSSSSTHTTKPRKSSFNQKNLELHLSDSQRSKIEAILNSVKELSDTEKLLLYLKLPTRENDTPATTNTKQEQTFAFQWIRNNLEECDNSVNLPKHEVYDEYRAYCEAESLTRFLSAPDFGKIVKCIYPNVKARRLGTRGNSKYCYNGLRRKVKQDFKSEIHSISTAPENEGERTEVYDKNKKIKLEDEEVTCDQTLTAASALICEWANKLLGRVFETLIGLAKFLISGSYVSTKSMASFVVMSASEDTIYKLNTKYSLDTLNPPSSIPNKNKVIKTEGLTPAPSSCHSKSKDKINIQLNEVNSTNDGHRRKSKSSFIPHSSQVVPDMPLTNLDSLGDFSIDITRPAMMAKSKSKSSMSNKLNDNIKMDKHRNKSHNSYHGGNSSKHNNERSSSSDIDLAKRRKKRLEQLQNSSRYPNNELSLQAQLAMKDATGFDLQSSFNSYPPVPQNGNLNMQMQNNQYVSWPVSSNDVVGTPDVDINSFVDEEYEMISNDQRCHTVPMARSKCFETDQSLTPHLGNGNGQTSMYNSKFNKPHHKAKRNLFNMFNNNNDANVPINSNNSDFFSNASLQNVPSVLPLSSKPNIERVVPTEPLKNIQGFSNVDMSQQDDDFSGIASNFYHVDGHELLKTCQPSDSWMNDWSNMTMPVMNFT